MNIDTTVNIWNILMVFFGAVVWIVTIAIAWTKFGGRMDMLEFRTKLIEDTLVRITSVLEKFSSNEKDVVLMKSEVVALQTAYVSLNSTVEDLRRGRGWIQSDIRSGVDGQYSRANG
jgi:hypothetical protein